MIAPSFIDEMNTDFCGDFFDNMDDILDFPIEDVEGGANNQTFDGGVCAAPSDALTAPSSFSPNGTNNNNSVLSSGLDIPNDDIAYLEWLSNFMEDSFSPASITLDQDTSFNTKASQKFQTSSPVSVLESSSSCSEGKPVPLGPETFISHQFQTSSPVSVLESSSSCSEEKPVPLGPETFIPGRGRPRTKRERPLTFKLPSMIHLTSSTFSTTETSQPFSAIESSSECEYFAESHPSKKVMKSVGIEQKKKKKKLSFPPVDKEMQQYCSPQPNAVRKCLHCEITKTPQWRAGPMGPKTLCNACGVRYKSGRLFPEYRPAASPTFVSSVHSNSHKKVLEMRNKVGDKTAMAATTPPPEMIPKSSNFLDYI